MKKRIIGLAMAAGFVVACMVAAVPAGADLYQYRDENGVLSFTDDLTRLTIEQRQELKAMREIKTVMPEAPEDPDRDKITAELQKERDELKQFKDGLDNTYRQIKADKQKLMARRDAYEKQTDIDQAEFEAFKEEVAALNERTKTYDARVGEYERRSNAFNRKLDELTK